MSVGKILIKSETPRNARASKLKESPCVSSLLLVMATFGKSVHSCKQLFARSCWLCVLLFGVSSGLLHSRDTSFRRAHTFKAHAYTEQQHSQFC